MKKILKRKDLIYPDLSYKIIGILFEVYNNLGPGYHEKYYQRATADTLKEYNLSFKEQVFSPLIFRDKKVGSFYLDFLIDDKIVLEIKKGDRFSKRNIDQVISYLKANNLKLGIIVNFGLSDLKFKRIINFNS